MFIKAELRPRLFSVIILVVFLALLLMVGMNQGSVEKIEAINVSTDTRGAVAWVESFSLREFDVCDSMLQNRNDGLVSSRVVLSIDDSRYYNKVLDSLVDCIESIKLTGVVSHSDGVTDYTFKVTYNPYKVISELVYNEDMLKGVKTDYENGDLEDSDFISELERVYLEIFYLSCFQNDSETETCETYLTLSEKKVNGVTCVLNTVSFVDNLLSDSNIEHNVSVYEKDVKRIVDEIIKAD